MIRFTGVLLNILSRSRPKISISSLSGGVAYFHPQRFPIIHPKRESHNIAGAGTGSGPGSCDGPVDIEVSVPWGVIAARLWNSSDPTRKPALCLHGWKDNAATFNTLIPQLVQKLPNYQFLAIDYPGHGFSSHFPPGMLYQMGDILVLVGRVLKTFKWPSVTIIGHSLGAIVGFLYTGTHNTGVVEKFVAIDALTPFVFDNHDLIEMIPKIVKDSILLDDKYTRKQVPLFTYEEILDKFAKSHIGGLDIAAFKELITRGVKESEAGSQKFYFTHDIRLKYLTVMALSPKQISCIAKNFRTPVLYIKADEGVRYIPNIIQQNIQAWLTDAKCQQGRVYFLKHNGPHHIHITNPQEVSDSIANFLNNG